MKKLPLIGLVIGAVIALTAMLRKKKSEPEPSAEDTTPPTQPAA